MTSLLDLPPSTARSGLAREALEALRAAVGANHVLEGEGVAGHVDPYSFLDADTMAPAAVVQPASTAEVQAVVRIAGRFGVPVWPVSRGRNYSYGGASPRVPGTLVIDLQRMDGVVSVDESGGVAVLQPGVSFMQLAEHLRVTGSALMASVPDIGWGSVIGNALERGFGYTPYGDHSAHLCGLEVVLPSGELIHTGMAAKAGSPAAYLYKGGYGPSVDGLFQQSNLGIVTQAGVWLMPRPAQIASCALSVPGAEDIGPLIDALRPLLLDGTIQSNAVIGNPVIIATAIGDRADFCPTDAPIGEEGIAAIMARFHLGYWNARFALYGSQAMVAARLAAVQAMADALPGADLQVRTYAGDADPAVVPPPCQPRLGIPSLGMARSAAWRGGEPAHTDFSMVLPPLGSSALEAAAMVRRTINAHGFDAAGGFTLFPRHMVSLSLLAFDRNDAKQTAAVRRVIPELVRNASALGTASYRSHVAYMDLIADQYDADDHGLRRFVTALKDAVDPQGLFAPGKQGVWPDGRGPA